MFSVHTYVSVLSVEPHTLNLTVHKVSDIMNDTVPEIVDIYRFH